MKATRYMAALQRSSKWVTMQAPRSYDATDENVGLLCLAAAQGDNALCRSLVDEGRADPNELHTWTSLDSSVTADTTPLHVAASQGHVQTCETLLNCGADVNVVTHNGWTPLMSAVSSDNADVTKLLLKRGAVKGLGGVHETKRPTAKIDALLRYGSPDYVSSTSATRTALQSLTPAEQQSALMRCASNNILDEMELLFGLGVDPNTLSSHYSKRLPPIHVAARKGNLAACVLLFNHGANLNLPAEDGTTPLTIAVQSKQPEIVEFLLQNGAVKGLKGTKRRTCTASHKVGRIGMIGGGAMGSAMLEGMLNKGVITGESVTVAEVAAEGRRALRRKFKNVNITEDTAEAVENSDVVIVCVKPSVLPSVLTSVKNVASNKLFISIAAGVDLATLESTLRGASNTRWVRAMPNIACTQGTSATSFTPNTQCSPSDVKIAEEILSSCGKAFRLDTESHLDAATGVAGSGIAYVFLFIEALADGGVRSGLPRRTALNLAAQTVLGASTMIGQTNDTHPGVLKDAVCSPSGTTIEAVAALERSGLRSGVIEAVCAAAERSRELGLAAKSQKKTRPTSRRRRR